MGLFHKKNAFLGIDFGASAIKVVEVTLENQQPHITNYASVPVAPKNQVQLLAQLLEKMNPESKNAYVALPGSSGLITLVTFPLMSKEELAKAISFEARKHIPLPLEEVNMSWDIVTQDRANSLLNQTIESVDNVAVDTKSNLDSKNQKTNKTMQVLLVAAPKKDVVVYEEYVTKSKLALKALELETFSLARVLVGDDGGQFIIIDIGAQATNIIALDKGVIRASRNIGVGGDAMVKSIADTMNIPLQRAFAHMISTNVFTGAQAVAISPCDTIVDEVSRVISGAKFVQTQVIITGGMAVVDGVSEYLTKGLKISVKIGDPWSRIGHSNQIAPYLFKMRGAFAVAAGLALRGAQEYQRQ